MTDWTKLSFKVQPTKSIIISRFCDGLWSEPVVTSDFNFSLDVFAGVFHYSNSCFEGLKAFRGKDGKVRIFRPTRMQREWLEAADILKCRLLPRICSSRCA